MPDLLTAYAQAQPDKLAVIDDRLGVDVRTVTYAEFEAVTNRLAHVLREHGVGPGVKVVWCGQNSMGIANLVVAARKVGATAVPLNYRLSDEEAAYVTDHSDATIVYVDAEFAPLFERVRAEIPKVEHILVFDGPAPAGMTGVDELMAAASTEPPPEPDRHVGHRGDDDLHVGHDRQAEGRAAPRHRRPGPGRGDAAVHRLRARRRLHHDRAALPQRSRRLHGHRHGARPDGRAAAQVRSRGLAAPAADVQGDVDVRRADADPHDHATCPPT